MNQFYIWLKENGFEHIRQIQVEERIGKMIKYLHKRYNETEKYTTKNISYDIKFLNARDVYKDLEQRIIEVDKKEED